MITESDTSSTGWPYAGVTFVLASFVGCWALLVGLLGVLVFSWIRRRVWGAYSSLKTVETYGDLLHRRARRTNGRERQGVHSESMQLNRGAEQISLHSHMDAYACCTQHACSSRQSDPFAYKAEDYAEL